VVTHAVKARIGITQRGCWCLLDLKYESDPCLKTNHRLFHLQFSLDDLLDLSPMPHFKIASETLDMMQTATSYNFHVVNLKEDMQKRNWDNIATDGRGPSSQKSNLDATEG
jgi:hypothetical protein